jgi:RND superfamily putative drug exporter
MPTPTLKVVKGPAEGGSIALEGDDLLIGREGKGEGLLGGDLEISRRHARVFQKGDKVLIEDLGSTNGTMVNGRKIKKPTELRHGDKVDVGTTTLEVDSPPPPEPEPAEAPAPEVTAQRKVVTSDVTAPRKVQKKPSKPVKTFLRVVAGPSSGTSVPITDEPFTIGRAEEDAAGTLNDDPELSRRHCQVTLAEGGLLIEDLGSTNGTFVNGRRIPAPTLVKPGDAVWVGTSTLVVTTPEQPIPEVAPVEPPTPSAESGLLARFAALSDRHPKRILSAIGVFFVIAAAVGGPVAGLMKAEHAFVGSSAESLVSKDRLSAAKGELVEPQMVVLLKDIDVDSDAARQKVAGIDATLKKDPVVARTVTFYNTRGDPQFISRDKRSTYMVVFFKDVGETEAEETAERLLGKVEAPNVEVGGGAVSGLQLGEQVGKDLGKAEGLAFPILFALSLWVFRGVVAALLPLFVGILTIFSTFFFLRIINSFISLSEFALNVVIALGLGLAIDYSLFIVSRYREELAKVGKGRPASKVYGAIPRAEAGDQFAGTESEALNRAIFTAGRTILYSAITVAIALASLLVFPQPFLYSMGIGGAVCALSAVTVALVALPALLALLGPRINSLAPARWQRAAQRTASQERGGGWYRLSQFVMKRPATIAVVSAGLLILVGLPTLGIKFTGVDITSVPSSLSARQVDDDLKANFPPNPTSGSITVLAEAPRSQEAAVTAFQQDLLKRPEVAKGFDHAPEPLRNNLWEITVLPKGTPLSSGALDLVKDIRETRTAFPVTVSGDSATFVDQKETISSRLPFALLILCVVTLIVLFLMTGSVILPLKSLLMNFLSLSAAFGLLVLIFQEGNLEGILGFESQGALELSQPVLLFAIAFGLSTDYAVFLLTRIKEARTAGASETDSVAIGLERTGRIVTQAALLFCIAIGAFATSSVIFIKEVGVGTALAVIIDATIIRGLLVPSLMALLGARNWWAPGPLRRLHEKIGLSEG